MLIRVKRKKTALTRPSSISQFSKAVRKGHVVLPDTNRLSVARHRRGKRGRKNGITEKDLVDSMHSGSGA